MFVEGRLVLDVQLGTLPTEDRRQVAVDYNHTKVTQSFTSLKLEENLTNVVEPCGEAKYEKCCKLAT